MPCSPARTQRILRTRPVAFAAGVALSLAFAGPASAQYHQKTIQQVGPFVIHQISENGVFNRCAATLTGDAANGMLRVAYQRDGKYTISVPGVPRADAKVMHFQFGPQQVFQARAATDPKFERAWVEASAQMIGALRQVKRAIAIDYDEAMYRWDIRGADMADVVDAVVACTQASMGAAGGALMVYPDYPGASQTCVVAVDPVTRREKVEVTSELMLSANSRGCKAFVVKGNRIASAANPNLCVNVGAGAHRAALYLEECNDVSVRRWDAKGSATDAARIRAEGGPFDNMC